MDNVVTFQTSEGRRRRRFGVPADGARILFFTGVRYFRDESPAPVRSGFDYRLPDPARAPGLGLALDLAAH